VPVNIARRLNMPNEGGNAPEIEEAYALALRILANLRAGAETPRTEDLRVRLIAMIAAAGPQGVTRSQISAALSHADGAFLRSHLLALVKSGRICQHEGKFRVMRKEVGVSANPPL